MNSRLQSPTKMADNQPSGSNASNNNQNNRSTNIEQGVEVSCKGYTNFKERIDIDLRFTAYETIGSGTFGRIHRIQYNGVDMALKIVYQDPDFCNRELQLLELLRGHEHIIHLVFSYYTRFEGRIYLNLITELLHHSLYNTIYSSRSSNGHREVACSRRASSRINCPQMSMTIPELQRCFKGIFKGLQFMHQQRIAHRDLKPENLGFTFGGDAKIIDMGSAKIMLDRIKHSHEVCTLLYRAPELLLVNQDYTCNIDIWSIGCIMAETIISMPLFFEQNPTTILKQIVSVIGRPPPEMLRNMSRINQEYLTNAPIKNIEDYLRKHVVKETMIPNEEIREDIIDMLKHILTYNNRISAVQALEFKFLNRDYVDGPQKSSSTARQGGSGGGTGSGSRPEPGVIVGETKQETKKQRSESKKHKMADSSSSNSGSGGSGDSSNKRSRN